MVLQEVRLGGMEWIIWLRIGTGGGRFECGDELSSSIKCREILD
jgi:hypothetical protein